jgi:hypothetical protein
MMVVVVPVAVVRVCAAQPKARDNATKSLVVHELVWIRPVQPRLQRVLDLLELDGDDVVLPKSVRHQKEPRLATNLLAEVVRVVAGQYGVFVDVLLEVLDDRVLDQLTHG